MRLKNELNVKMDKLNNITEESETNKGRRFEGDEVLTDKDGVEIQISRELTKTQRKKALELLSRYTHIFTTDLTALRKVKTTPYSLVVEDPTPVTARPYPLSSSEREIARKLISDLEKSEVLKKSKSKYCSSAFLKVKKGGGVPRLLVNYKPLNRHISSDMNAVARVDTIVEALQKANMYSVLDLAAGYYQFLLAEESHHLTAFRLDSCPLMEYLSLIHISEPTRPY